MRPPPRRTPNEDLGLPGELGTERDRTGNSIETFVTQALNEVLAKYGR